MGIQERRLREKEERYATIRRAAMQIFANQGLQEATMDEIAQAAQLSKGAIYYYFPSKESLTEDLIRSNLSFFFEDLCDESARSLLELGEGVVSRFLECFAASPEAFKVLYLVLADGMDHPGAKREIAMSKSERGSRFQGAIEAFRVAHQAWLAELQEHVQPLVSATPGLTLQAVVDFIGMHFHGILMMAVSGRDLAKIREESGRVLRAFFKQT